MAAALKLENVVYRRDWVCEERCFEFLHKFASFDDFVVDAVGHAVAQVSFRRLVSFSDEARSLSPPYLENRVDYPSALSVGVSFAPVVRSSLCKCLNRLFGADRPVARRSIWLFRTRCYGFVLVGNGALSVEEAQ